MKKLLHIIFNLLFLVLFSTRISQAESHLSNFALTQSSFISAEEAAKLVWDTIENEYIDLFEPVSIDYSEWGLIVYVECKGLASELKFAYEEGFDQEYQPWVEYKTAFLAAYNTLADLLDEHGRNDLRFELRLYNDDSRAGKRSPFIQYLAFITSRDSIGHDVMWRYVEPEQDESELPEDIRPIRAYIKEHLETVGFDYISLFYNESSKLFIVEVAIKNVGANLYDAKQAGNDENYMPWKDLKKYLHETYNTMLTHLNEIERTDISIMFELVNDEVHISGYNDRVSFDPLYAITNVVIKDGFVLCDAMK